MFRRSRPAGLMENRDNRWGVIGIQRAVQLRRIMWLGMTITVHSETANRWEALQ